MTKEFLSKVLKVQGQMLVEKGNRAKQYQYRSLKDVNAKAKPICNELGLLLTYTDDLEEHAGRVFVISKCVLTDVESGESMETKASVEIDPKPQFMSLGQNCGASSSYARKYSADAMFCLDGECDLDEKSDEVAEKRGTEEKAKPKMTQKQTEQAKPSVVNIGLTDVVKGDGETTEIYVKEKWHKLAEMNETQLNFIVGNEQYKKAHIAAKAFLNQIQNQAKELPY